MVKIDKQKILVNDLIHFPAVSSFFLLGEKEDEKGKRGKKN